MTEPCAVYRHLNAAGETLYIGCSVNPFQRFACHLSQSSWITEVVQMQVQWFASKEEATGEEKRLILSECPPNNRLEFPRRKRDRPQTPGPRMLAAWMAKNAVDDTQLARLLGITKTQVQALLQPTAAPQNKRQRTISVLTSGEVPSRAWCARDPSSTASPDDAIESRACLERWGLLVPSPLIPTATEGSVT